MSERYRLLASRAVKRLGLTPKVGDQHITRFPVDGEYNSDELPSPKAGIVPITRGYSRDNRADLNQVALELVHAHQTRSPVALQVLDGNQNDTHTLCHSAGPHLKPLRRVGVGVRVKDSAGYSAPALHAHQEAPLKWVMRVPATRAEAKKLLEGVDPYTLSPLVEGDRYPALSSEYGGVQQRWLLLHSRAAKRRGPAKQ